MNLSLCICQIMEIKHDSVQLDAGAHQVDDFQVPWHQGDRFMNLLISTKESCRFLSICKLLKSRICTADTRIKKKKLAITYKYANDINHVKNNDVHRKHIKQRA